MPFICPLINALCFCTHVVDDGHVGLTRLSYHWDLINNKIAMMDQMLMPSKLFKLYKKVNVRPDNELHTRQETLTR